MEKNVQFSASISLLEKVNPLFTKAKVKILYLEHNRNGSYFTKESVEQAIPTMFNTPIVGQYLEETENFGGHGVEVKITDDSFEVVHNTKPYGVIPESAQVYWETDEDDGKEYLVADGIFLWTGRYPELNHLLEDGKYGQSMEIEITSGEFSKINDMETFRIDSFIFSAFCILGIEKNGEGHVEPAFENASITAYSFNKEEFKSQFSQMMEELKFSLKEGGEKMEENKDFETVETIEETETEVVETQETVENPEENQEFTEETPEVTETQETTETEEVEEKEEEVEEDEPVVYTQEQYDALQQELQSAKDEVAQLMSYKRQREEQDLASKFEGQLTTEEFTSLLDENKEASLEDIETKAYALIGKKNFSVTTASDKKENKVTLFNQSGTSEKRPYNGYFDKYLEQ